MSSTFHDFLIQARHFIAQHRWPLRLLLLLAILATLADGLLMQRDLIHLLVSHPLQLLASGTALMIIEEIVVADESGPDRDGCFTC
jgi:hypothetical protein